ncbi:helix-turn-helix transcriptional regulator [Streptomyces sp. NPDC051643]|uniref:helix-turn-helix transcriptional regulator n=1 Tax=Streptomyces sp. NPDC051643 TaxID=3365665 RepID=UPI0037B95147
MARERQNGSSGGTDLGSFLRARRTHVSPEEAGLRIGPTLRRAPGLRREELATLAGVSIDYYTRLERGRETRPSPAVVDALAGALRLDAQEHEHLRDLVAGAVRGAPRAPVTPSRSVRPGVRLLLENLRPNPAHVISRTADVLACNPGGMRLLAGLDKWPVRERNVARYVLLHPDAPSLFDDWDEQVRACVGRMRALAGTDPDAPDLAELVDELLVKSPDFARLWDHYDVRLRSHGHRTFHHPEVGDLTLGYQSMHLEGTPGHRLVAYYAEPGTPGYDAMTLLDTRADRRGPRTVSG